MAVSRPTPPPSGGAPQPAGQGLAPAQAGPALTGRADGPRQRRWSQAWLQAPAAQALADAPSSPAAAAAEVPSPTPLRDLRGLHASRRAAQGPDADAGLPGNTGTRHGQRGDADLHAAALAAGSVPAMPPAAWPGGAPPAGDAASGPPVAADAQTLHALVDACCARLLVQAPAVGAPAAVLLQLQGGLAGCALELQRVQGSLRLTLRVAAGERRDRLASRLADLGDALARTLGCPVVLAVQDALDESLAGRPR